MVKGRQKSRVICSTNSWLFSSRNIRTVSGVPQERTASRVLGARERDCMHAPHPALNQEQYHEQLFQWREIVEARLQPGLERSENGQLLQRE